MTQQLLTERRLLIGELGLAVHLLCFVLLAPYSTAFTFLVRGLFGWFVSLTMVFNITKFFTFFCVPFALGVTALLETRTATTTKLDVVVRVGAKLIVLVVGGSTVLVAFLLFQGAEGLIVGFVTFVPYYAGLIFALVIVFRFARGKLTAAPDTV